MTTLAFTGPDSIVRDVALSVGLIVAGILLAFFTFRLVLSGTSKPRIWIGAMLVLIAFVSIACALREPAFRLVTLRRTAQTANSILQFCFKLSDSDMQSFGIHLDSETWERVPPDGYRQLIARARTEGQLRDRGCTWTTDGGLLDAWQRPFGIAVSMQNGKRVVIVDSLGPDGLPITIDDIQRSDAREIPKRQ
jgi:hypothetical protein